MSNGKKKGSNLSVLMGYAGRHRFLTYSSWVLSGISALLALAPFIFVWLIIRDVINAGGDFSSANNIVFYGWMAVGSALLSMFVYFGGRSAAAVFAQSNIPRNIFMDTIQGRGWCAGRNHNLPGNRARLRRIR